MGVVCIRSFPAALLALLFLLNTCLCFNPKLFHATSSTKETSSTEGYNNGLATWYGDKNGPGTVDGACGYTNTVCKSPLNNMTAAGSSSLYVSGKGCGRCYLVRCTNDTNTACSGNPVKVFIMDQAPDAELPRFDLSGTAMGALATPGKEANLRNAGKFNIQYQRTDCEFSDPIKFKVDTGSNSNYMALLVEYVNGDADIERVQLKESGSERWQNMTLSWGAVYMLSPGHALKAPMSVKVTLSSSTGGTHPYYEATDAIPDSWVPGTTYSATSNFT